MSGTGAAALLVLPSANAGAFSLHLAEITQGSRKRSASHPRSRRRWIQRGHGSRDTRQHHLFALAAYSPELNPMDNVWEYLRQNKLAVTVFNDCGHIVDNRCVLEFLRRR
jgi:hypothetical protein